MKRRPVSPFSLSFLDIMFCGFGAVVLLVLILNHETVSARNQRFAELRAEALRLEQKVLVGSAALAAARNRLALATDDQVETQGEAEEVAREIHDLEVEIARLERETLARREHVNRLGSDLKNLDTEQRRLGAQTPAQRDTGEKVREFRGEGDRQYLTGLKLGGERILILVDSSASMLDETIINVVRRRNMGEAQQRGAPKWQRTLATVEWLVSNLPARAYFQLYRFNTQAAASLAGSDGKWLRAADGAQLDAAVRGLRASPPGGGTSLYRAFAAARELSPRPDNILLVTDGLPTQGRDKPAATTVSGRQRLAHFEAAVRHLGDAIPVNTILLPMEGDAWAAAAYWKLAVDTRGSFLTPARDWP